MLPCHILKIGCSGKTQSIIHTLSRKWKFGSQVTFTSCTLLLLLEFHQAVRHKSSICERSVKTLAAEVSERHVPSARTLCPIQAPATFRLVLGIDISAVLSRLHSSGRKTLAWWYRGKAAAEGGKWANVGNQRSYNDNECEWENKLFILLSPCEFDFVAGWFYSCVEVPVYSLINAEQCVHALNILRISNAHSCYSWSFIFLGKWCPLDMSVDLFCQNNIAQTGDC